ncbi:hypothetical protein F4558_005456 [Micromonospora profundi]|uniref:hypothetical protein n=1 Tax=Micromonospora profundi TaxID=1420889 RepID=UPI00143BBF5B|nr:hypothetical protein [Micromonospora profundi]NJC15630.1 hypothetical protein [Micromonospora profundi]
MAAFTTLLIEYLAKPWLEVRKERILDRDRRRRGALHGMNQALFLAGRLVALREAQDNEVLRERAVNMAAEIEPLVMTAVHELEVPARLEEEWTDSTSAMVSSIIILKREPPAEEVWQRFDIASEIAGCFADLLGTPRRRWRKRRKLVKEIRSIGSPRADVSSDDEAVRAVQRYLVESGFAVHPSPPAAPEQPAEGTPNVAAHLPRPVRPDRPRRD